MMSPLFNNFIFKGTFDETNNDEQTSKQSNKQNEEAREEIDVLSISTKDPFFTFLASQIK